jgi:hypothetical protein
MLLAVMAKLARSTYLLAFLQEAREVPCHLLRAILRHFRSKVAAFAFLLVRQQNLPLEMGANLRLLLGRAYLMRAAN